MKEISRLALTFVLLVGCGGGGGGSKGTPDSSTAAADAAGDVDASMADSSGADRPAGDGALDGAGDGPPPLLDPTKTLPQAQSGTRLKAGWTTSENGSKVFGGWHDSMLNVFCSFARMSDGKEHCMPFGARSSGLYSDDKCTKPVHAWSKDACQPDSYVYSPTADVCPYGYKVYIRKAKTTEILNYEKTSTGACRQGPALFNADDEIYELEELPPTMFVAATDTKPGAAAGGLAPLLREGSDGSRELAGWQDTTAAAGCVFRSASDLVQRCLPIPDVLLVDYVFSESTCKKAAGYSAANSCAVGGYVLQEVAKGCTTRTIVRKVGEKVKEGFYRNGAGACVAYPADRGYDFYAVGEEVPAATFPGGLTRGILPGEGRLVAYGSETAAGGTAWSFYDTQLGMRCSLSRAADGMLRCLPTTIGESYHFKDSLCAEPIVAAITCGPQLAYTVDTKTCPQQRHVRKLKDMYKGTSYVLAGASCVAFQSGAFYTLGDEVPATDFALLSTTIDP